VSAHHGEAGFHPGAGDREAGLGAKVTPPFAFLGLWSFCQPGGRRVASALLPLARR
jgi:hypothetical protein